MDDIIYAISLWEPWALLMPLAEKEYETRSWQTPRHMIGCLFVIHAAKRWTADERRYAYLPVFQEALRRHGYSPDHLPLGAAIGTARLLAVYSTNRVTVSDKERAFGNYQPNRFAWKYGEPRLFDNPIPYRGQQGIWKWDMPLPMVKAV